MDTPAQIISAISGLTLILIVLWDAFETVILPRRVTRRVRLARLFYRLVWRLWLRVAAVVSKITGREANLSYFGPLSLIMLLSVWAFGLVCGFALLLWADGSAVKVLDGNADFLTDLYLSGTTFFTLGLGDVVPRTRLARLLIVIEAGMGIGFLALLVGYFPALNQSFSRREVNISLLDARAGSPATAGEMLRRHSGEGGPDALRALFADWEIWSAELLESHLSYPVLAYFRSQHDNQSWVAALTAVMDASALVIAGASNFEQACQRQAQLTFAITEHTVFDLSYIFGLAPSEPKHDRLPPSELARLRAVLAESGLMLREGEDADAMLAELRGKYEPYLNSLSAHLRMDIPPWLPGPGWVDNWQTSFWNPSGGPRVRPGRVKGRHF
ncbi:MAG TPA: potassium channel family protein [Nitrospirota bacterium]|jgi:hypothetical protein